MTLYRGDLIGSGTVGTGCILELGPEKTGGWIQAGDVIEMEIERLGTPTTPIAQTEWPISNPLKRKQLGWGYFGVSSSFVRRSAAFSA